MIITMKKNMRSIILSVAATALLAGSAAESGETARWVLYPKDRSVAGAALSVVLEPAAEKLPAQFFQLIVNSERGPVLNGATMPHAVQNIGLLPGENRIVVSFFEQQLLSGRMKKVASQELTVYSVQTLQAAEAMPPDFNRTRFHQSGNEVACQECHELGRQVSTDALITAPGKVCLSCHAVVAARSHVHSPVKAGSCAGCHDRENKRTREAPTLPGDQAVQQDQTVLCGRCHGRTLSGEFTHGPAAAGFCTYCHDPHSGPNRAQLRKPVTELCAGCHAARSLETCSARTVNANGSAVECTMCHDPHGAGNSKLLLARIVIRGAR